MFDEHSLRTINCPLSRLTEQIGKKLGGSIKIVDFARFTKGEGIEKRQDNFAEEIANLVK